MKKILLKFNKIISSILLVVLFIATYFLFFANNKTAEASWWNPSWQYRRIIKLTNTNDSDLVDFQTMLEINTQEIISNSKMNSDCSDLRFALGDGTAIDYVIEENNPGCNATNTKIWIKVPRIYKGAEKTDIYMYHGNSSASDAQDGTAVFEFYDNFDTFSTTTWENTGDISTTTGELTVETGVVRSKATVAAMPGLVVESKLKWIDFTSGMYSGINVSENIPVSNTDKLIFFTTHSSLNNRGVYLYGADDTGSSYNIASTNFQFSAATSTNYILGYSLSESQLKTYKNRENLENFSGTWSSDFYLYFGYFEGNSTADVKDMTIDWVQIRKFAETMPTHTTANIEEERPGGPVGYWDFNEGYGTTAHDNSGMGNDGAITGATWKDESECVSGGVFVV